MSRKKRNQLHFKPSIKSLNDFDNNIVQPKNMKQMKTINKILLTALVLLVTAFAIDARTYVLVSGVSNYAKRGLKPLTQSTKDAKSMWNLMKSRYPDTSLLTGENANHQKVAGMLTKLASAAGPDDQIFFFFSGHGGKGVFCLSDENMTYTELITILSKSKCKQIVVLIDACHSGSMADAITQLKAKGVYKGNIACIVSSRASETSIEAPVTGSGFLAQGLIKGLRGKADGNGDKKLTLQELFNYTFNDVTTRASRFDASQHPQLITPASLKNMVLWTW